MSTFSRIMTAVPGGALRARRTYRFSAYATGTTEERRAFECHAAMAAAASMISRGGSPLPEEVRRTVWLPWAPRA
jgi:hypothetical protein